MKGGIAGFGMKSCTNINYVMGSYKVYRRYGGNRRRCYSGGGAICACGSESFSKRPAVNNCSGGVIIDRRFTLGVPRNTSVGHVTPLLYTKTAACSPLGFARMNGNSGVTVTKFNKLKRVTMRCTISFNTRMAMFSMSRSGHGSTLHVNTMGFVGMAGPRRLGNLSGSFHMVVDAVPAGFGMRRCMQVLGMSKRVILVKVPTASGVPSIGAKTLTNHHGVCKALVTNVPRARRVLGCSIARGVCPRVRLVRTGTSTVGRTCRSMLSKGMGFECMVGVRALGWVDSQLGGRYQMGSLMFLV